MLQIWISYPRIPVLEAAWRGADGCWHSLKSRTGGMQSEARACSVQCSGFTLSNHQQQSTAITTLENLLSTHYHVWKQNGLFLLKFSMLVQSRDFPCSCCEIVICFVFIIMLNVWFSEFVTSVKVTADSAGLQTMKACRAQDGSCIKRALCHDNSLDSSLVLELICC